VRKTGDFNRGKLSHRIELLDTNKGVLSFWWDEPLLRKRMLAAGLDRETLYGCALNFLFRYGKGSRVGPRSLDSASWI
jgi:hypothetical protein